MAWKAVKQLLVVLVIKVAWKAVKQLLVVLVIKVIQA